MWFGGDTILNKSMNKLNREVLFPTPIYFKDLHNSKELNKYLFKHIKKWFKSDPKGETKN